MRYTAVTGIVLCILLLLSTTGLPPSISPFSAEGGNERDYDPNIFLIMTEATRADHIGPCYGYNRTTAQNICELAEDGILFQQAYSHATFTHTAVPTLLTSLPPTTGITLSQQISEDYTFLAERLNATGYKTSAATVFPAMPLGVRNFYQGIETVESRNVSSVELSNSSLFLWVFLRSQAHYPYTPDQQFRNWDNVSLSQEKLRNMYNISHNRIRYNLSIQDAKDLYDGEILQADHRIGNFISKLKEQGIYDRSIIIYTSDHGESFKEHGQLVHSNAPYEEEIHVPLIIKLPHNQHAGKTIKQPVGHKNIVPTLLDYLPLDSTGVFGNSILPLLNGKPMNISVVSLGQQYLPDGSRILHWAVRSGKYKYIYNSTNGSTPCETSPAPELYNIAKNPDETHNIATDKPYIVRRLRKQLCETWREGKRREKQPRNYSLTEDMKQRLKDLGYLTG